ncbi:MAG: hypothetical protein F6K22_15845 [Okeania sp. SIO2F4]|uniref:hypothetical protein n=1 Tax=Okeania sp. SIO2F4 TaxID=2607790 RepID=UPI00142ADBDE|nr:hypothetical protein [Okeania sp. SIO2F4]NES04176.1 hypothetical protein [Okeania sp. SIO2F4]
MSEFDYDALQELNTNGYDIYIVVNGEGYTDADVEQCKAIFYEHDNLSITEQENIWQKLNLPQPTIQVYTGGKSVHNYWVFDKTLPTDSWKILQADLLEFSGGDPKIKNPSRLMRLPGFYHQKGTQARIINQSGERYSYNQLRNAIPKKTDINSVLFPAILHRYYGNPIALWLYCRFYDINGSGRVIINLNECASELEISVSTIRKWLCWERRLWRSWKTRRDIATIYYVSSHNLTAKADLERFGGGVARI